MTRVYTAKNVCGNTTGLLPVYCQPPLPITLRGPQFGLKIRGRRGAEKDHKKDKQVSSLYKDFCYYYNVMSSHNARSGRAQLYSSNPLNVFNTLDFRRSSPDASLYGC